jgi:hypothetical protein
VKDVAELVAEALAPRAEGEGEKKGEAPAATPVG